MESVKTKTSIESTTYQATVEKIHKILPGWYSSGKLKKIVIVTGSTWKNRMLGIPHMKDMIYEDRETYVKMHGLEFMWATLTSYSLPDGSPIYWNKSPILKEAFVRFLNAERIWRMDMDIIIMNMSLSIYDHALSPEGMARNALSLSMVLPVLSLAIVRHQHTNTKIATSLSCWTLEVSSWETFSCVAVPGVISC
ncbi:hypothetical protein N7490_008172 [Penicillium lividum]|nr:hypothetical protein N7490_008172 [Penicillium lividum]